jgi:starch synthase (maltosyl-transferring)
MSFGKEEPVQIGRTEEEGMRSDGDGRRRVVVEGVSPEIEGGRFPIKRVVGEKVVVQADIFGDGHDSVSAFLLYRSGKEYQWHKAPMIPLVNDRWEASFMVEELGTWHYTVEGRIDHFRTWRKDLAKKFEAGQDLEIDRLIGVGLIDAAVERAGSEDARVLKSWATRIRQAEDDPRALALAGSEDLAELMDIHYDPELAAFYEHTLQVTVEPTEALFSAWYELFPRSCCAGENGHGTIRECERLLPEIARMGFDVVYFPPIHPIGQTNRKGRNNAVAAGEDDPGSPWAIGAAAGGHKAVHPLLGSLEDFERFVIRARELGIRIALDIAFQCSPDHPYVREHPAWFRWRPGGTVQFAENPPKKYEDIIPFDFETDAWQDLWRELKSVFDFWIERGITIFRVDNPHTKPFSFWEWVIAEIKRERPEIIFLSEAFTRPKVMYRLAKGGFSQSYTYFSWRNTKWELEQYLAELCRPPVREFFRPNFWPNTPDILPEFLQYGGRPAFIIRYLLAATLSGSYGIYGPPFELFVNEALPGKEEYVDSEKYEIKCWDWTDPRHMRELITQVNRIRRENPALQTTWNVRFCETDSDEVLCYTKISDDGTNLLLIAVSLDPFNKRSAGIRVPLEDLAIPSGQPYLLHELLGDSRGIWHRDWNEVELDPGQIPAKIFRLHRRLRREQDFDYFM